MVSRIHPEGGKHFGGVCEREEMDLLQCVEGVCVLAVLSRTCAAAVLSECSFCLTGQS